MADQNLSPVIEELFGTSQVDEHQDYSKLSLEALILLINAEKLKSLKDHTNKELDELQERQEKVRKLHNVLRKINSATDTKGALDFSKNDELKKLIKEAHDLDTGIDPSKTKYTKDERDRLVENIRIAVEDYNVQNDMQLQTVSRLTNERYECYQMVRSILKPLNDDKLRKAREIAGR